MKKENCKDKAYKYHKQCKYYKIAFFTFFLLFLCLIIVSFLCTPKIALEGKKEMILLYKDKYKEKGYKATLYGKDITKKVKIKGKVNTKKIGFYQIEYSVQNGIFKEKKVRKIYVIDKGKPRIILKGENPTYVCPNQVYKEDGYKALDNYEGDMTKKVNRIERKDHILYSIMDRSGNTRIVKRKLIYEDKEKPNLTLNGNETEYILLDKEYKEKEYKAFDNCDGDLTSNVKIEGSVNTKEEGTYILTYKVKDHAGNETEKKRKVIVYKNIASGCISPGTIYLTFDDGPMEGTTEQILNILKEEKVKATFFVTRNGEDSFIQREHKEGHAIGLHTYSHNYAGVYASIDSYFEDLNKISDRVYNITGTKSKIIRFPGGSSNTISRRYNKGIMTSLTNEVVKKGYLYYDWNIDSGDAGKCVSKGPDCIYNSVTSNFSKNKCNMVLMHDIKWNTANALREIIHYGKNNGYKFDKIEENMPMIRQKVNN